MRQVLEISVHPGEDLNEGDGEGRAKEPDDALVLRQLRGQDAPREPDDGARERDEAEVEARADDRQDLFLVDAPDGAGQRDNRDERIDEEQRAAQHRPDLFVDAGTPASQAPAEDPEVDCAHQGDEPFLMPDVVVVSQQRDGHEVDGQQTDGRGTEHGRGIPELRILALDPSAHPGQRHREGAEHGRHQRVANEGRLVPRVVGEERTAHQDHHDARHHVPILEEERLEVDVPHGRLWRRARSHVPGLELRRPRRFRGLGHRFGLLLLADDRRLGGLDNCHFEDLDLFPGQRLILLGGKVVGPAIDEVVHRHRVQVFDDAALQLGEDPRVGIGLLGVPEVQQRYRQTAQAGTRPDLIQAANTPLAAKPDAPAFPGGLSRVAKSKRQDH